MFRRLFQQALWVWLAFVGLVVPARAAAVGEQTLTPTLSHAMGEGGTLSRPEYRITHWTAENGLPQNSIKALAQTRDGYLWIGTLKGLARFDGVRFKVFDHNNTPEMTHDSINDLAEDRKDGSLWIGTGDGLFYYRDHSFEQVGPEDGIRSPISSLWPAREGGVWFSSRHGQIALAHEGRVKTWEFGPDRIENSVHQIGEEGYSGLIVLRGIFGGYYVLERFDLNRKSLTPLSVPTVSSAEDSGCFSFLQDADGPLWLCTSRGIWHGSESAWTEVLTRAGLELKLRRQRIYRTSDGQVWVTELDGKHAGLQRLVHGRLESFEPQEFSTGLYVTRLLEDHEGNLWVGTTTGLFRLEPKRIRAYSRNDGLRSDETLAVAKGADGTIWVGMAEGINSIRDGKVENPSPPAPGVSWERAPVFLADRHNALWVGWPGVSDRWRGPALARFQHGKWEVSPAPEGIAQSGELSAIYEDREGRMWIGTGTAVLCREGEQWSCYSTNNGLSHRDVRVIYQDRRGDMWFGTYGGGLNRLKDGKFTAYKNDRGELNNCAWWIHEDADGVFWVGSEDGLNRFTPPGVEQSRKQKVESRNREEGANQGRFFTFTTEQGLGENVVNNIQEDEFGCLWLSGLHGIYRVSRQQLNEVATGQRTTVECIGYGEADGMLNSECNGGDNQPAGCKDDQGRIWFPTAQGVVMIDPKEMQRTEAAPPAVIEQVRANREVIFGDGISSKAKGQRLKAEVGSGLTRNNGRICRLAVI
jgi:ligand-binding sensor domain-containing protein